MKNNFNCNRDGLSIQADLRKDCDASQSNFEENIARIDGAKYFYTDWGNIGATQMSEMYVITDATRGGVIDAIIEHMDEIENSVTRDELKKMTNKELRDNFEQIFDNYDTDDENLFEIDSENFEKHESKGYSQGDCVEVFIAKKKLVELWGVELDEESIKSVKDDIGHYFWDSPFSFNLTVDGEEVLTTSELLDDIDSYESDTQKILAAVAKKLANTEYTDAQQQEINEFLVTAFPENHIN